jgi:hypothetical protein
MTELVFDPVSGLNDTTEYPEPSSGAALRAQLQDIPDQIRDYINNTLLGEIESADAALVLEALGLSEGCIDDSAYFVAGIVNAAALATNAVTTVKITDANVTAAKLATDAVETAKIKDANVTAAKLATNAVETTKILNAAVTADKIAGEAVTLTKLGTDVPIIINGGTTETPTQDPEDYPSGTLYGWYSA